MTKIDLRQEITSLVEELHRNAKIVKFGEVILSLKIHDSRIVLVTNSIIQNTIQKRGDNNVYLQ